MNSRVLGSMKLLGSSMPSTPMTISPFFLMSLSWSAWAARLATAIRVAETALRMKGIRIGLTPLTDLLLNNGAAFLQRLSEGYSCRCIMKTNEIRDRADESLQALNGLQRVHTQRTGLVFHGVALGIVRYVGFDKPGDMQCSANVCKTCLCCHVV